MTISPSLLEDEQAIPTSPDTEGVHHVPLLLPRPHQCSSMRTRGRSRSTPPRQEHPDRPKQPTLAIRTVSGSQLCADDFARTLRFTGLAISTNHGARDRIDVGFSPSTRSASEFDCGIGAVSIAVTSVPCSVTFYRDGTITSVSRCGRLWVAGVRTAPQIISSLSSVTEAT